MRAYTSVPAGLGYSTVLPDLDFECYSEAGYVWIPETRTWKGITKTKPGLNAVGAAVYSEHPSTEVLCLAYDLKDGIGERLWLPGMPAPQELFDHIAAGGLLEAHNSGFEYYIWLNVCHKRMGWPALPFYQLRCSASKARAFSLPGALGKLAHVLGASEQKDTAGEALIRKHCIPHNPTKTCPSGRNREPESMQRLYSYCRQDIKAESAVSLRCPNLSPDELHLWLLDQEINTRGVHIDQQALQNCISIINQSEAKYTAELQALTGGTVSSAGELAKIIGWLGANGVHVTNLDAGAVDTALERKDLPPACRKVLEIRSSLGAASVKKLFAIERMLCSDGRLRDLFVYCGADRTGRFAGRGPQPQNLTSSGPKVVQCGGPGNRDNKGCGRVHWKKLLFCPYCGKLHGPSDTVDWGIDAIESALEDIATLSLQHVENRWGDAVAAVSGCLRGLFSAAPGHDLICADYSAIEAVVLSDMAGEEWRQEVFRTHGKIYEMSASKISGIPFDDFLGYKKQHGVHHPLRKKVGKVAELACFTRDTQVLTKKGLKRIEDVTQNDLLWDGIEWVRSGGAVCKGKKAVINVDGVRMTPNHPISLGDSWRAAQELVSSKNTLHRALAHGLASTPWSVTKTETGGEGRPVFVPAGLPGLLTSQTFTRVSPQDVVTVGAPSQKRLGLSGTQNTRISCPILSTGVDWLTGYVLQLRGAIQAMTRGIKTTVAGGFQCVRNGEALTGQPLFSPMYSLCLGGITQSLKWIGLIRTGGTSRVTLGLSAAQKTPATKEVLLSYKNELTPLRSVYDIVNAGPRHRFMIKTNSGYLLVHNSGYGGGLGAWKAFGADEFMTDEEITENVKAWRKASPQVYAFWYGVQDAAYSAVSNPGTPYTYQAAATRFGQPPAVTYYMTGGILYCQLPSGRTLTYHQPALEFDGYDFRGREKYRLTYYGWNSNYLNGPVGWMKLDTWGGKLTENIIQAVARDLLASGMKSLAAGGYPIVLHVHDEIVAEVPAGTGDVKEFERLMSTMPTWAAGWPVKAAGGWRGQRYRKD